MTAAAAASWTVFSSDPAAARTGRHSSGYDVGAAMRQPLDENFSHRGSNRAPPNCQPIRNHKIQGSQAIKDTLNNNWPDENFDRVRGVKRTEPRNIFSQSFSNIMNDSSAVPANSSRQMNIAGDDLGQTTRAAAIQKVNKSTFWRGMTDPVPYRAPQVSEGSPRNQHNTGLGLLQPEFDTRLSLSSDASPRTHRNGREGGEIQQMFSQSDYPPEADPHATRRGLGLSTTNRETHDIFRPSNYTRGISNSNVFGNAPPPASAEEMRVRRRVTGGAAASSLTDSSLAFLPKSGLQRANRRQPATRARLTHANIFGHAADL